jgi:excisionase family DNA binding protein
MSAIVNALLAELDDAAIAELAGRLAPLLERRLGRAPAGNGWLNSDQAAAYLGCPRSRIHDLVQLGKLVPRRDGRRLLFRPAELDAYLMDVR